MHSILRIDEVRKGGISKVSAFEGSNVTQFPTPIYTPTDRSDARVETRDTRRETRRSGTL